MTLKTYLILMGFGAATAWAGVGIIVTAIDPATAPRVVLGAFYAALFLALTGTFAVAGFGARATLLRADPLVSRHALVALRQGMLLAALTVIFLALTRAGLFTWWTAVLALGGTSTAEYFFVAASGR